MRALKESFDGQVPHVTLVLMQCGSCGPGDSLITALQSVLEHYVTSNRAGQVIYCIVLPG